MLPLGLDKEGRGLDNPSWIKAKIMPLREDVTGAMIEAAVSWCAQRGMIVRYEVDGRRYFYVPSFPKYQDTSREAPSNYPAPLATNSRPTQDLLATNSRLEERREEERRGESSRDDSLFAMQELAETITGLPATVGDIDTLRTWEREGVIESDIRGALQWRKENLKKPAKTIAQLAGGVATERSKRIQDVNSRGNGSHVPDPASYASEVY